MKRTYLFCFTFVLLGNLISQDNVIKYSDRTYLNLPEHSRIVSCLEQFDWYEDLKEKSSLVRIIERKLVSDHLEYDLYLPGRGRDFPLLIFLHGGSFIAGNKANLEMQLLGEAFALKGIAFASIEYRTQALSLLSMTDAGYLAIQDLAAAVSYFKVQSENYSISNQNIFVGGVSAGAIAALNFTFLDEEEIIPDHYAFLDEKFGCLKCSHPAGSDLSIRGVVSINGGMNDPEIMAY